MLKCLSVGVFKCRSLVLAILVLLSWAVWAQTLPPNLGPSEIPSKPLTVIFKDITRHELFRLVEQGLRQNQLVKPFVMRRAQRGLVEYEGLYAGEKGVLLDALGQTVAGRVAIQSRSKGEQGLEITITPGGETF